MFRFACIAQDLMDCRLPKSKMEKLSIEKRSSCDEGTHCTVCLCTAYSTPSKLNDTCEEMVDKRASKGKDAKKRAYVYGGNKEEWRVGLARRHLINKRKVRPEEAPSLLPPTVDTREEKVGDGIKDYDEERKKATSRQQKTNNDDDDDGKSLEIAKLKSEVHSLKSALTGLKIWLRNIPDTGEERYENRKGDKEERKEEETKDPEGDLAMGEKEEEEEKEEEKEDAKTPAPNIKNRTQQEGTAQFGQREEEMNVIFTNRMAAATVDIGDLVESKDEADEDVKNFAFGNVVVEEDDKSLDVQQNRMGPPPGQNRQAPGSTTAAKAKQEQTKKKTTVFGKQGKEAKWKLGGGKASVRFQQGGEASTGSAKDRVKGRTKGKQGKKTTAAAKEAMGQQLKQGGAGGWITMAVRMPMAPKVVPKNSKELTNKMAATTTKLNERKNGVEHLDLEEFSDFQADIKEKMTNSQLSPRMAEDMQGKFDSFLRNLKQLKTFQNRMKAVSCRRT